MLSNLFALNGRTAIVTGASYGLGVTLTEALAAAGANVVAAARSRDKLQEIAARIAGNGGNVLAVPCDVADPGQVKALVDEACRVFGRVDILVNNAGVAADSGMMPEKVLDSPFLETLQVNVAGAWYCCREAGARMLADGRGGTIVNIASVLGLRGLADLSPGYHASKAALISLTRHLAASWGGRGVRVNAIAPGWFASEMTASLFRMPGVLDWATGLSPLKRLPDPKELVGPLLFLASDASSFVNGHTLVVDGGASVASPALPDGYYDVLARKVPGGLGARILPTDAVTGD